MAHGDDTCRVLCLQNAGALFADQKRTEAGNLGEPVALLWEKKYFRVFSQNIYFYLAPRIEKFGRTLVAEWLSG